MSNLLMIGLFAVVAFVLVGGYLCWASVSDVADTHQTTAHKAGGPAAAPGVRSERSHFVEPRVLLFAGGTLLILVAGTALAHLHIRLRYGHPARSR